LSLFKFQGPEFASPFYRSNTDGFEEAKLSQFSFETAIKIIELLDSLESDERTGKRIAQRGGVLAFLPGLMEIDTMYKMCNEYSERRAM
jgi:HrpA-like RNA helicase